MLLAAPSEEDATRSAFWDARILRWEASRYSPLARFNPCAWTVRSRLNVACRLIRAEFKECRSILDLGCGSGPLAQSIVPDARRTYRGVDFSSVAIEAARARYASHAPRICFERGNVLDAVAGDAELAVFLGLTDWLEHGQMDRLISGLSAKNLLFSFTHSESAFIGLYRRYRGRVDGAFRPRNYRLADVAAALARGGYRTTAVLRSVSLGPGRLVLARRA
jgi:SAM-dependent methyltransferase